jgi:acetylornithine deacetylase/succinyl-diaminopimelate desuccinylase-like protein
MRKTYTTLLPVFLLAGGLAIAAFAGPRPAASPAPASHAAVAQAAAAPAIDWRVVDQEALDKFTAYLRVDTTNPPGNEVRGVDFYKKIFEAEGIPYETGESAPGRGNIVARLKGQGNEPALILLNHMDVVPVDQRFWTVPAFEGLVKDGYVWGRGSEDMKSTGIAELMAFLLLHRNHVPLKRDVIFLATADEEAGGNFGAGWVQKNRPEWYRGAGFLLNEGGESYADSSGKPVFFGIDTIEKTPAWLRLTVTGRSGHGSIPIPDSATNRLIAALDRLRQWQPPLELTPPMERGFVSLAPYVSAPWRSRLEHMDQFIREPNAREELAKEHPGWLALLTNTVSITQLEGSKKVNVIGPEATASLDCRLLPGTEIDAWISQIRKVLDDPSIKIDVILNFPTSHSPDDSALVDTIRQVVKRQYSDAGVIYTPLEAFTDSHLFRERGVASYGFSPFAVTGDDARRIHGNDERIPVQSFESGIQLMYQVVYEFSRQ